jgi:alpha-ketoglutaric semialdehyde dehydrogenase
MSEFDMRHVLIDGRWRAAEAAGSFRSLDPSTGDELWAFPISAWADLDEALDAGTSAYRAIQAAGADVVADFLDDFADRLEVTGDELLDTAARETALPRRPRIQDVELPRTVGQMRQAAKAARERSWTSPVLSPASRIAARLGPLPGVAVIFGPNNFPLAFNSVTGGDSVAALATGHPIVAKANPGHPETTRLLAMIGMDAARAAGLPDATIQLVYGCDNADGFRLVADRRVACTAFTGSFTAGSRLKAAADAAGALIHLEMSAVNPVVVLPGAWSERGEEIAAELADSILVGAGQFCTNPGLIVSVGEETTRGIREGLATRLGDRPAGTLLGAGVAENLRAAQMELRDAGASLVVEGPAGPGACSVPNTLLEVSAAAFVAAPERLATEAFGNCSLLVTCADEAEARRGLSQLRGNLTGTIYSSLDLDSVAYAVVEPVLRERVGRLLNDKVPTGVAVDPAMNHGGPYPSSGHPAFTAVGIPASLRRFGALQSYDNVPGERLPEELRPDNPLGIQRCVDGVWTTEKVSW